jgi:hypothetical protein
VGRPLTGGNLTGSRNESPANAMIYQLTWKILPGLRGLSCSDFRASPTSAPNNEQGVAFECANEAECVTLIQQLEAHFGAPRFSNNASAFETVKAYVLERTARR